MKYVTRYIQGLEKYYCKGFDPSLGSPAMWQRRQLDQYLKYTERHLKKYVEDVKTLSQQKFC